MTDYVIRGGERGYERLQLLARSRWADTAALFERAGIGPGMRCLDLGCGGGAVTLEIAKLIAPHGSIVGVDMDEVKLALARRASETQGLDNVEFRAQDVGEWNEPGAYDFVYSRFLLQHLRDPGDLLRRMWAAVGDGGVLAVEDADFDGWACHPPNEGFEFFLRIWAQVLQRRGGDHAFGRKLYGHFRALGIPDPHVTLACPVNVTGENKTLAWSTLEAATEAITDEGIATDEELAAALADLARFTEDPSTLTCGPRVFQVWSRRS
ncbi:MAG TPA: class I SAM-dependent methyltransferase [Actinomycetota bacterium]